VGIGPVDVNMKPRNTTWLQYANLLFVDNPIGTGFSYTDDPRGYCTTDEEIADQLVQFLKTFLVQFPVFTDMQFWIFSESYGGKMTANFGVALNNAIKQNEITIDFQGVALGDSWIDPVGCMYSYPDFLYSISQIDENEANNLTYYAQMADESMKQGNGVNATYYWNLQQEIAESFTDGVNFYNFMHFDDYIPDNQLNTLMNGPIKTKLNIIPANVTWGGQSNNVFEYMQGDFMRSGVNAVDTLLNEGYQVAVYSGQLDIIVDVICIDRWIEKMHWTGVYNFENSKRQTIVLNGVPNGYVKSYKNFSLWNILDAGHMVPYDNGAMALYMFKSIIGAN